MAFAFGNSGGGFGSNNNNQSTGFGGFGSNNNNSNSGKSLFFSPRCAQRPCLAQKSREQCAVILERRVRIGSACLTRRPRLQALAPTKIPRAAFLANRTTMPAALSAATRILRSEEVRRFFAHRVRINFRLCLLTYLARTRSLMAFALRWPYRYRCRTSWTCNLFLPLISSLLLWIDPLTFTF